MTRTHLITGATGFLGRRVAAQLLTRGDAVTALVRADDAESARRRLLAVLPGATPVERLHVIAGALEDVPFDVRSCARRLAAAGTPDTVWHLGALVDLGRRRTRELVRVNVEGTRGLLAVAAALDVARFHHVGTAYSCGWTDGPVPERAVRGAVRCRNPYEASKRASERLAAAARDAGLPVTIHRPSIVVGDGVTGRTDAFGPFYHLIRVCALAADLAPLVLPARADAPLDLVPVDRVVAALLALDARDDTVGGVFHLTHPQPPLLGDVADVVRRTLGLAIEGLADVAAHHLPAASQAVLRAVDPVLPYLRRPPRFDRRRVDAVLGPDFLAPHLENRAWLAALLRDARDQGFGVDERTAARERRVLVRRVQQGGASCRRAV